MEWDTAIIRSVNPTTNYKENEHKFETEAYIEIEIQSKNKDRALIIGNIPTALLVHNRDFKIPSFGVGVFQASEFAERRYLRVTEGPNPSYSFLAAIKDDDYFLLNNHAEGLEEIYLRPFIKNDRTWIRMTVVSYERIIDLFEYEIPLNPELENIILKNSKGFRAPAYETYQDHNLF